MTLPSYPLNHKLIYYLGRSPPYNHSSTSSLAAVRTTPVETPISRSLPSTMSSSRMRRIAKEVADIHSDTLSHIVVNAAGNGDDLTHLKGSFKGPPGTPYEGGNYSVDVKIPSDYPFRPPIMKFDTKLWHPNVSSQTVCISVSLPLVSCN